MSGRGERLAASLGERELDQFLITDIVNVGYLTGFGGTNGACICGEQTRLFLTDFRYTERAAAEVEDWEVLTVEGDWLTDLGKRLREESDSKTTTSRFAAKSALVRSSGRGLS